jgi:hypothetical protein
MLFDKYKFKYVFHFAAYAAEGLSGFKRNFFHTNNILSTGNIINNCINYNVERLVFTSSMSVYGDHGEKTFDENDIPKPLDPYAIGKYTKFLKDGSLSGKSKNDVVYSETDEKGNTKKLELGAILKKLGMSMEGATGIGPSDIEDTINSFFGWQTAPGGFRASIDYVDSVQTGTLMLKIGPYYRLKNLIIQDIQLNYSKHIAKYFDKDEKKVKTCPLYCEVAITFTPANKYSDKMLKEFVMSRGRSSSESNSIKSLEKTINEKINIK